MVALVQCLKDMPVELLSEPGNSEHCEGKVPPMMYPARVDGTYIPDDPKRLLKSGAFHKDINVMLGTTATEGYLVGLFMNPKLGTPDFNVNDLMEVIVREMAMRYPASPPYVWQAQADEAIKMYCTATQGDLVSKAYADFGGDSMLILPTYETALDLSGRSSNLGVIKFLSFCEWFTVCSYTHINVIVEWW